MSPNEAVARPSDGVADARAPEGPDAFVCRHQVGAWRYLRLRGCPADLAEDLVQEALLAALRKGIDAEPAARAHAWLQSALENLWLMHLRSEQRRERRVSAALAVRAMQQCAGDDDDAWTVALRSCLASLDGRARRLLDLHYADQASRAAIAREFGLRSNGVKAFLQRVRRTLRDCVLRRLASQSGSDDAPRT